VSSYYLLVHFLTRNGVREVRGDQRTARQCLMIQDKHYNDPTTWDQLDPKDLTIDFGEPMERTISVPLTKEDPTKIVQIGSMLDEKTITELICFLRDNADVFAWSASDMPRIPVEVITHRLEVAPWYKPVQ